MQTSKKKPARSRGYVLYEGPSVLDGAPIVMIMTMDTANRKTGNMIQTWIIRSDVSPLDASRAGKDHSICGNCPHKWSAGGACYVNIGQAPTSIYKAYKRGAYTNLTHTHNQNLDTAMLHDLLENRFIRLGAYGDPAAVPVHLLQTLTTYASGHTGYTHQMRHKNFDPAVLNYCMASADTLKQATNLWANAARTFRIAKDITESTLQPGEIECLADAKGIPCSACRLCDGKKGTNVLGDFPNIVIAVHGARSGRFLNNKTTRA